MKFSFRYLILFFAFSLLGVVVLLASTIDPRIDKLTSMHEDRLKNANINIVGVITDMDNKKLDDVVLTVEFARPRDLWATASETSCQTIKTSGDFSIQKRNFTSVTISFMKHGYRSQTVTLYTGKPANAPDSATQDLLHVRLQKIGVLIKTTKIDMRLEYDVKNNSRSVCNISELSKGKIERCKFHLGKSIDLSKYLFLDFERNTQGEIIYERNNARGIRSPAPQTYLLHFVSQTPDDGFILADTGKFPSDGLACLANAPSGKYTSKTLIIPYRYDQRYYFFIKCGNFYGKGVIKNIDATCDPYEHTYSLLVEVVFNQRPNDLNLNTL